MAAAAWVAWVAWAAWTCNTPQKVPVKRERTSGPLFFLDTIETAPTRSQCDDVRFLPLFGKAAVDQKTGAVEGPCSEQRSDTRVRLIPSSR
jgi:hypothetical protein